MATGHLALSLHSTDVQLYAGEYSADGQRVVTISSDHIPRIWEAASGRQLLALEGHTDQTWSARFSTDGKRVVTASWDRTARIWDSITGQELLKLRHSDRVFDARFSPDGTRVITGSHDTVARIWDAVRGQEMLQLIGHNEAVDSAAFSPDGRWFAYSSSAENDRKLMSPDRGVFVQPFPATGGKWQVSTDGGTEPVWNRNGHELFYRSGTKMMASAGTSCA